MMHGWGFGGGGGMHGGGGGGGFAGLMGRQIFEEQYHCYSVAYADKSQLEVSTVLYNSRKEITYRTRHNL